MFRRIAVAFTFSWLFLLQACGQSTEKAYHAMLKGLYSNTASQIKVSQLEEKLNQRAVVLLDTRSAEEFKVSHIKGARYTGYDHFDLNALTDVPKDAPLVVYCSVGYRSEKIGEKLQQAGYTNVQNLYGGIFQWVNDGRPVYNSKGYTDKVHAYSRSWGIWLRKGEKVYGE